MATRRSGLVVVAADAVLQKESFMTRNLSKSATATAKALQAAKSAKQPNKAAIADAPGGKLGKAIALLRRPKGATLADLMKATDWQQHSVRGAISGSIKKKLKLAVISEKVGNVRTCRIKG
jgi:Protein of unknown function (DUF3489)